ncbi:MAG: NADPH:quinone reductase [Chloroflexi bacterium]|nr:NADPH:quinone reductase [Chloroflexota bacterium]
MRAAFYERQGAPHEVLQVGQVERPEPAAGEVRVKVHASGVNPSDTYGRAGGQAPMAFARVIPHQDGAGVIDAVGEGVPKERVGERVWVYEATWNRAGGTAAEYTVVPARRAVKLPDAVDFDAGACLGIPALTAHRALFADGALSGQTILVTGAAGAVGSTAVQLAKWGGARVIGTISSQEKANEARTVGADEVINYRTQDVVAEIKRLTDGRGVERIVEVDFGGNLPVSLQVIKPDGVIASYATRGNSEPNVPFRQLMVKNILVRGILVYTMPEEAKVQGAKDVTRALQQGALKPRLGMRMPLDQIAEAHAAVERGAVIGNVVLYHA